MRITDLRATVVKVPRSASLFSGGAGVRGVARRAPDSSYQIIDPYPTVYSTMVETLLISIETDAGVTGLGEGQCPVAPEAGAVLAERLIRPLVLGEDPLQRDHLYARLYSSMRGRGHGTGFLVDVIAGVDNALWDLAGQVAGEPCWHLLGGRSRDRIPAYLSGLVGETRDDRVREALSYRDQGFRAVKIFAGHGVDEDLEEAAALREALGPDIALCVDPQWMYDPPTAIRLGRGLERLGVMFLETPVEPEDVRAERRRWRARSTSPSPGASASGRAINFYRGWNPTPSISCKSTSGAAASPRRGISRAWRGRTTGRSPCTSGWGCSGTSPHRCRSPPGRPSSCSWSTNRRWRQSPPSCSKNPSPSRRARLSCRNGPAQACG